MGERMSEADFEASKKKVPTPESKGKALDLIKKANEVNVGNQPDLTVDRNVGSSQPENSGVYIGENGTIYRGEVAEKQRQANEAEEIAKVREEINNTDPEK